MTDVRKEGADKCTYENSMMIELGTSDQTSLSLSLTI